MATKLYSNKQEKMIAEYLGWETVAASGARDFCPGDVRSADWLGECKTHVGIRDRILVDAKVWAKIEQEAMSVFKKPVLFVDDGTQKADHTWCVLDFHKVCEDKVKTFDPNFKSRVNLIFKHSILFPAYNMVKRNSDKPVVATFQLQEKSLGIMSLYDFNELFGLGG